MKLIVGLGNPEERFNNTRHNIGFDFVDEIQKESNSKWKKFSSKSEICVLQNIILLKPLTYMNSSGESIREIMNFYKIPQEDIIVFYDDMDLIPGRIKINNSSSSAGHNGIKSILSDVGDKFVRVRVGIGRPDGIPVIDYVLGKFGEELEEVHKSRSIIIDGLDDLLSGKYDIIITKCNSK